MTKHPKRPRDLNQWAKHIVDLATGQVQDPTTPDKPAKDPAAVSRGRLGGKKGGKVRAATLSKERRTAIAKKAAKSRWKTSAHSE
jgi:hypothetical protein